MRDSKRIDEYYQRLIARYTAPELAEILNLEVEDILVAFEDKIQDNAFLIEEVGMLQEEDNEDAIRGPSDS